ncbi:hypothetical protein EG328_003021 [Venturia inaequalis]|uniref:Mid2 domain-containing protein n=1 Tax=Venturia inaequalis TaxID=5025 RepID=A0A8H3USD2_VENIN|nr:hypothetical protein EG328_003021 [Venturia inaequalis]
MLQLLPLLLLPFFALGQTASWDFPKPYQKNSAGQYLFNANWDVWHLGDILELRWNTTLSNYNIVMEQGKTGLNTVILRKDTADNGYSGMKWTVQRYNFDLSLDLPFYFDISSDAYPAGGSTIITRTNYFNISSSPRDTAKSVTTCSSTSNPCPTNKCTFADEKNRTMEIGLGLGLGIPLLIALISIFFLVRRLRDSGKEAHIADFTKGAVPVAAETNQFSYRDAPKYSSTVHEISTRSEVHEAPGGTQY